MFISHGTGDDQIQRDAGYAHAALMLIEICFRATPIIGGIIDTLVARLQASMEQVLDSFSYGSIDRANAKSTFWALCVGGIAAVNRPERAWFMSAVVPFCVLLDLKQ